MRIIVASDNKSTRDAIGMLVRVQPDLELAGEADDLAELLAQIKATESSLVVFDWDTLGHRTDTLMDLARSLEAPWQTFAGAVFEVFQNDWADVHRGARAEAFVSGIRRILS